MHGEGNGNPLQCPCLENPRDGRVWWTAICGVAQSQTQLKRLSNSSIYIRWASYKRKSTPAEIVLIINVMLYVPEMLPFFYVHVAPKFICGNSNPQGDGIL